MLVLWDLRRDVVTHGPDKRPIGETPPPVPDPATTPLPPATPHVVADESARELRAIRDRIGLTRIFYTNRGDTLLLSDQVSTLLAALPRSPEINLRSVVRHLCGISATLPTETFFEGIHEVPSGHVMTVSAGRIHTEEYWSLDRIPPLRLASDEEYDAAFRNLLFEVVPEYLPHGEVALTLSGGLDSTTLAAAIAAAGQGNHAIAFGFVTPELPEADESSEITEVARKTGLRLRMVPADHLWPLSDPGGLHPTPDSPVHNIYTEEWEEMFRRIREQGIGHVLTGLSGDHLFGVEIYAYSDLFLTLRWIRLIQDLRAAKRATGNQMRRVVRRLVLGPLRQAYLRGRIDWAGRRPDWVIDLIGGADTWLGPPKRAWMLPGRWQRHQVLRDPNLAVYADALGRQARDHEIRLLHPLLDHRLVEFAASLPATQTAEGLEQKRIVRGAMRGRLPDVVLDRRGKRYPIALAHRGLREKEQAKVWHLLDEMRAADLGVVDPKRLRAHYQAYLEGDTDDLLFWNALTLEAWLRGLP